MNIKNIKNPSYIKTWIIRILINSAMDRIRKAKNIIYIEDYQKLDSFSISESEFDIDASFDLLNAIDKLDIKFKNIVSINISPAFAESINNIPIISSMSKALLFHYDKKLVNAEKQALKDASNNVLMESKDFNSPMLPP